MKQNKKSTTSDKKMKKEGLFVPAGIFLGLGLGFLLGNLVGWMFLGLGAGFLTMALLRKNK
jgi:asparagine N-glycosylation enzyme membrane subunit Stt3